MTDAQVTQTPTIALSEGSTDARVTQTAMQALVGSSAVNARVTQIPVLSLYSLGVPAWVTQVPILVLYSDTPCVSQTAQCWRITRTDDVVLGFTTHDQPLTAMGTTFQPCDSLRATAAASSANVSSAGAGDIEMTGIISDAGITEEDLYSGRYDNAIVEVFEVSWDDTPDFEMIVRGQVSQVTHGGAGYAITVQTSATRLAQQPLLTTYSPGCRHVFGDTSCGILLASVTVTGSVTTVFERNAVNQLTYRAFADSTRVEVDDYFVDGVLTWTSGANIALQSQVKSFSATQLALWDLLPNEIQLGDTYSLTPGCPKTVLACQTKWASNNIQNFGGFPHVPGKDLLYQTPDSTG
jgi:uncharacterized phage protein (TIGR02218 family)